MEEKTQTNGKSSQRMIREAIRKIALGRSIDRYGTFRNRWRGYGKNGTWLCC